MFSIFTTHFRSANRIRLKRKYMNSITGGKYWIQDIPDKSTFSETFWTTPSPDENDCLFVLPNVKNWRIAKHYGILLFYSPWRTKWWYRVRQRRFIAFFFTRGRKACFSRLCLFWFKEDIKIWICVWESVYTYFNAKIFVSMCMFSFMMLNDSNF